jgi:hypothetical protein
MGRRIAALVAVVVLGGAATSGLHAWAAYTSARWAGTATFTLNRSSVTDVGASAAADAIQTAMNAWNNSGANVTLALSGGDTNASQLVNDGVNAIFFRQDGGGAIATNYTWWDGSNRIVDSDIVFWNGGRVFFTGSTGCSGGYYIEDIVVHELGHGLGLDHSYFVDPYGATATMYPTLGACDQNFRTLSSDDIDGVRSLYPGSRTSSNSAPSISISSPANGTNYLDGTLALVTGSATDSQDGSLTSQLTWTDNGVAFGTGGSPQLLLIGTGTHTIEAWVTDSGGLQVSRSVSVSVVTTLSGGTGDTGTGGTRKGRKSRR